MVRWMRRRHDASTRTSPTRTRAETTVPVLGPHEVAQARQLAQVVVPPGQVEQQVADVVPVEPDPGPAQDVGARPARTWRSGVDSSSTGSVGGGARGVRRAAGRRHHAYSAEIRYR